MRARRCACGPRVCFAGINVLWEVLEFGRYLSQELRGAGAGAGAGAGEPQIPRACPLHCQPFGSSSTTVAPTSQKALAYPDYSDEACVPAEPSM